jgi:hypothetical protein
MLRKHAKINQIRVSGVYEPDHNMKVALDDLLDRGRKNFEQFSPRAQQLNWCIFLLVIFIGITARVVDYTINSGLIFHYLHMKAQVSGHL